MPIRLTAHWQTVIDERILERLRDVGETNVILIATHLEAGSGLIRDRLRMLAQVELVEVEHIPHGRDWFELSYWGILYLRGEYDVGKYITPHPNVGYRKAV